MMHLARRLHLVCLAVCAGACAAPCSAVNLAVNFTDAFATPSQDVLRVSQGGAPQTPYETGPDTRGFMSLDSDAVTGKLYGLGRYANSAPDAGRDFVRAWDADGTFTDVLIDYSAIGLAADANAPNLLDPDISVHNGHIALNYSDAFNPPRRDVLHVDAATGAALANYAIPDDSLGVVSLDYDAATGRLYGLGQYAFNAFDRREDFIRVWEADGTLVGDIDFNFESIGLRSTTTIADSRSPDIAVHDGHIAVNITDDVIAAKHILHLDVTGSALAPYWGASGATTFLSLDYDPATGDLYGLGQYAFNTFSQPEDLIRRWVTPGAFADSLFNFGSIGLEPSATVGGQASPDLAVATDPPGGNVLPGDYNDDGCVDMGDYATWRDNLGKNVTLPNDLGLGGPVGDIHYQLWRLTYGLKILGPEIEILPADYNVDGVVDAADYAVWRARLGGSIPLPNDAGLGTPVGDAHYQLWRDNYGSAASGPAAASPAPEPASGALALVVSLLCACALRARP